MILVMYKNALRYTVIVDIYLFLDDILQMRRLSR